MCRAASGSDAAVCTVLELSWRRAHDPSEPQLWGTDPDALLTCSDREQMGRYLPGQKSQLCSPPDPHALNDHFRLVKCFSFAREPQAFSPQKQNWIAKISAVRLHRHQSHLCNSYKAALTIDKTLSKYFGNHSYWCFILAFNSNCIHRKTRTFLWFTPCVIPHWLVRPDAVLIINKVKQTLLYIFQRVANNDVYYYGDLTSLRPYFQFLNILSTAWTHVFCSKFLFTALVQIKYLTKMYQPHYLARKALPLHAGTVTYLEGGMWSSIHFQRWISREKNIYISLCQTPWDRSTTCGCSCCRLWASSSPAFLCDCFTCGNEGWKALNKGHRKHSPPAQLSSGGRRFSGAVHCVGMDCLGWQVCPQQALLLEMQESWLLRTSRNNQ